MNDRSREPAGQSENFPEMDSQGLQGRSMWMPKHPETLAGPVGFREGFCCVMEGVICVGNDLVGGAFKERAPAFFF